MYLVLGLPLFITTKAMAVVDRPITETEDKKKNNSKLHELDLRAEPTIKSNELSKTDKQSKNEKNKFEELLIWKLSDDLKLTVGEEKKFSQWMRDLNHKKNEINGQIEELVQSLAELNSNNKNSLKKNENEKLLIEYRRLLKSYNELSIKEVDNLQKIIGVEKTGQYLVFKSDLTNKLKQMLTPNEKSAPLPPPKVIQE